MAEPVTVVAVLHTAEGREADVEAALSELVAASHAEEGCVRYVLHRDAGDARRFVFVEQWSSDEALVEHASAPHMAKLGEVADAFDEPPAIYTLERLDVGDAGKNSLG